MKCDTCKWCNAVFGVLGDDVYDGIDCNCPNKEHQRDNNDILLEGKSIEECEDYEV